MEFTLASVTGFTNDIRAKAAPRIDWIGTGFLYNGVGTGEQRAALAVLHPQIT